jgi:hypothetical protein
MAPAHFFRLDLVDLVGGGHRGMNVLARRWGILGERLRLKWRSFGAGSKGRGAG